MRVQVIWASVVLGKGDLGRFPRRVKTDDFVDRVAFGVPSDCFSGCKWIPAIARQFDYRSIYLIISCNVHPIYFLFTSHMSYIRLSVHIEYKDLTCIIWEYACFHNGFRHLCCNLVLPIKPDVDTHKK